MRLQTTIDDCCEGCMYRFDCVWSAVKSFLKKQAALLQFVLEFMVSPLCHLPIMKKADDVFGSRRGVQALQYAYKSISAVVCGNRFDTLLTLLIRAWKGKPEAYSREMLRQRVVS